MNKILELREKRAKAWEAAKAFLDTKRGTDGLVSAEDTATYEKMEADVVALGKEIDRLEKQEALDRELSKPLNTPLTGKPAVTGMETKTGRASDEYRKAFWNAMRTRAGEGLDPIVKNALQIGTDIFPVSIGRIGDWMTRQEKVTKNFLRLYSGLKVTSCYSRKD